MNRSLLKKNYLNSCSAYLALIIHIKKNTLMCKNQQERKPMLNIFRQQDFEDPDPKIHQR